MVVNQKEIYIESTLNSITYSFRSIVTPGGLFEIWHMDMQNHLWYQVDIFPNDNCDSYALCGPYGSCSTASFPNCGCLKGFEPLSRENWTRGCQRSKALNCEPGKGFFKMLSGMKLPDTQNAMFNNSTSIEECEVACKNNCSCIAYATNMTGDGIGCLQWFGDLIDVRVYPENGQDFYIRLADSEFLDLHSGNGKKQQVIKATLSILAALIFLALIMAICIWRKKRRSNAESEGIVVNVLYNDHYSSSKRRSIEVPVFSFSTIASATNNFSNFNKLGEGGFGPVYKGELEEGQQIAVKRLSKFSQQGLDEFKNEVICIAKLQHRNLVKLLGYCIQEYETMLIYEYMPNKSLDWFIFDDSRKSLLDWTQRFHIIQGVARGLLYLHQDSRLRIVHRDLKAGNILLDQDMNPKISDFGLARVFKEHESERKSKKVVGTMGYIPPEYAVNGLFSVKSDIFSFGVLVLEIVSGKKNSAFVHADHHDDSLLGHAWRLYHEGKSLDLVDTSLGKSYSASEVLRSVHLGLLCVQQRPEDRPSTPFVVSMLGYEGSLPSPKLPGLFIQDDKGSTSNPIFQSSSVNGITISLVEGRK
uniref:G-type lectin S-receptor-like serine/threonine-protein kinase SD1-1 isoform X2 n=1 Tax=Erigeron canadensis TaxID=72917 RepID=UPI001CB94DFA|nr:G-type lectin S-receptor-like serine/threonine-protein kinase SD1-1 isoform X2 [Erigeron canadensis]